MKGLRFRMTDQQHEALSGAARRNGRSLQKEIELRVFGPRPDLFPEVDEDKLRVTTEQVAAAAGVSEREAREAIDRALAQPLAPPAPPKRTEMCPHRVPAGTWCKRCES